MKPQHDKKYFLFLSVFIFFFSFSTWAEDPTDPLDEMPQSGKRVSFQGPGIGLMGGLITAGGDYGGNFLAEVDFKMKEKSATRIGILTGLFFGSGTSMPILLSIVMHKKKIDKCIPYMGFAVGPTIGLDGTGVFDGSPLGDSVRLAFMLRMGLKYPIASNVALTGEIMTGGLTGIFYVSPMVGATIRL